MTLLKYICKQFTFLPSWVYEMAGYSVIESFTFDGVERSWMETTVLTYPLTIDNLPEWPTVIHGIHSSPTFNWRLIYETNKETFH